MSSAAFSRAHNQWLMPPENDHRFDDWTDAQAEKKELLEEVSGLLSGWYESVDTLDELDEVISNLEIDVRRIKEKREEIAKLEDEFPADYIDECPDDGE